MIESILDLKKLFKLCREQGITEFKMSGIEIKFGDLPREPGQYEEPGTITNPYANFPQGELSPEQLIFYSSGGKPDEDPLNKEAI